MQAGSECDEAQDHFICKERWYITAIWQRQGAAFHFVQSQHLTVAIAPRRSIATSKSHHAPVHELSITPPEHTFLDTMSFFVEWDIEGCRYMQIHHTLKTPNELHAKRLQMALSLSLVCPRIVAKLRLSIPPLHSNLEEICCPPPSLVANIRSWHHFHLHSGVKSLWLALRRIIASLCNIVDHTLHCAMATTKTTMATMRTNVNNKASCASTRHFHIVSLDGDDDNTTAGTTTYVNNKPLMRRCMSFILQKQHARSHELLTHCVAQRQCWQGLVRKRTTTGCVAWQQRQQGLVRKRTTTHRVARRQQQQGLVCKRTTFSHCIAWRRRRQGLMHKRTTFARRVAQQRRQQGLGHKRTTTHCVARQRRQHIVHKHTISSYHIASRESDDKAIIASTATTTTTGQRGHVHRIKHRRYNQLKNANIDIIIVIQLIRQRQLCQQGRFHVQRHER